MNMTGKDIILGLLMEKERTGYELNQVFSAIFSHFYKTSYGMIYPALKKLQAAGLVKKELVIQEGKPNKNIFSVTEAGREEFLNYLTTDFSPETRESEFLVRMYFGGNVMDATLLKWLEKEIRLKQEAITQLKSDFLTWEPVMSFSQKISYEIGLRQYEAEIEILESKMKELQRHVSLAKAK